MEVHGGLATVVRPASGALTGLEFGPHLEHAVPLPHFKAPRTDAKILPHLQGPLRPVRVFLWRLGRLQPFQRIPRFRHEASTDWFEAPPAALTASPVDSMVHPTAHLARPHQYKVPHTSPQPVRHHRPVVKVLPSKQLKQLNQQPQCTTPTAITTINNEHCQLNKQTETDLVSAVPQNSKRGRLLKSLGHLLLQGLKTLGCHIQPQGVGHNDRTFTEQLLNVISCAPFLVVGTTVLRSCHGIAARRFGHMFLVVSGVAAAYHATSQRRAKRILRVADYWCIAASSCVLRDAILPPPSTAGTAIAVVGLLARRAVAAGSIALIPFAPSIVSTANFALVEVWCAGLTFGGTQGPLAGPAGRIQWVGHAVVSIAAGACFFMETRLAKRFGVVPGMHAAWHVLSALGMITMAPFLRHMDSMPGSAGKAEGLLVAAYA